MQAIAIVGTGNGSGKSLVAAAICRLLKRRGLRALPFAADAAPLSVYTTETGAEIAYAQALQAWAAGIKPRPELNPVIRQQDSESEGEEITIAGETLRPEILAENPDRVFQQAEIAISAALAQLETEADVLVCDGKGSVGDRLLWPWELNNFQVITQVGAKALLVVDADRGGWLTQIVGTLTVLEPTEREALVAIALNRFRGDRASFHRGAAWLRREVGLPLIGSLPWLQELLPSPDSIDLFARRRRRSDIETTIAVIWLPASDGFSDLDPLSAEPTVELQFLRPGQLIGYPDAVVLPRSRNLLKDLNALFRSGTAEQLRQYAAAGGTVLGLCEGFEMLGRSVILFQGLDNDDSEDLEGLELLPISTISTGETIERERIVTANQPQSGLPVTGRELRRGFTQILDNKAVDSLFEDNKLGLVSQNRQIWGSYIPDLFDSGPWRRAWLNNLRNQRGLSSLPTGIPDYQEHREILIDNLADHVAAHLDLSVLFASVGLADQV